MEGAFLATSYGQRTLCDTVFTCTRETGSKEGKHPNPLAALAPDPSDSSAPLVDSLTTPNVFVSRRTLDVFGSRTIGGYGQTALADGHTRGFPGFIVASKC